MYISIVVYFCIYLVLCSFIQLKSNVRHVAVAGNASPQRNQTSNGRRAFTRRSGKATEKPENSLPPRRGVCARPLCALPPRPPHPLPPLWVPAHLAFPNEGPGKSASGQKSGLRGGGGVGGFGGGAGGGGFGGRALSAFRWSKKLMTDPLCCEKAVPGPSVPGNHRLCQ